MSLSKSFYSVHLEYFCSKQKKTIKDEYIFNDFNVLIRFRRSNAEEKFIEIMKNEDVLNDSHARIEFIFHEHYWDHDFDNGLRIDFELCSPNILFEFSAGVLKFDFHNWAQEAILYEKEREMIFGKYVKVKNNHGDTITVINDHICNALGIDHEYFDWDKKNI